MLYLFQQQSPAVLNRIAAAARQMIPGFHSFLLEPSRLNERQIVLKWYVNERNPDNPRPYVEALEQAFADDLGEAASYLTCNCTNLKHSCLPNRRHLVFHLIVVSARSLG